MNDNKPQNLYDFEFSGDEGKQSFLTLLNLIPDPAVIYQRELDIILIANNPMYLITNLGEMDFIGQSIRTLVPELDDTDPISDHNRQVYLKHKKMPSIPVTVRIFPLSQTNEKLLLVFKPEEIKPTHKEIFIEQMVLLEDLNQVIRFRQPANTQSLLKEVLQKATDLLNADLTILYKASVSKPQLIKYESFGDNVNYDLPMVLANEDLENSPFPSVWSAGEIPTNHVQKIAANAGYSFLVMVPLGEDQAKFGLFIAASKTAEITPITQPLAKIIAAHISIVMENHSSINNLKNLVNKVKQVVRIQSEIINNLTEGVIILSPDLTIAEINPATETILGYANVEALRQHIDTILIGSDSLRSAIASAQQGIPTLTGGELTLHHRNGQSFPAQVMMSPVLRNAQVQAIIILIRDLSQQEQNQAVQSQLEQRALLGEVTAIFAHEVRNPINAIMLTLQVMEDNLEGDEENLKWIENMREECNKLLYLMESVLSFAKPLEYRISQVDLGVLLPSLLERWRPRLLRLNIAPYFESEMKSPIVEGDPRALEQVFTNLISNSVNAMSEKGGSLGIKIAETDHEEDRHFLEITITDTGHGIPDEIKAHMFKPFVTGSNRGTGLGLAITQRIINAHKGKIEVDSFAGGTIFRIFLTKLKGLADL